jgi:beta-glucosidase-like glycosyl hydrolase
MKMRQHLAAALLAGTSVSLGHVLADSPSSGDALGLWTCGGAYGGRQAVFPDAAGHVIFKDALVYDIDGPSNATGTAVHAWGQYTPVHGSQLWAAPPPGGTGAITSRYNGLCLSASFSGLGAPLVMQVCNVADPLQSFAYDGTAGTLALSSSPSLCAQAGNNTPTCLLAPFSAFPYCNSSLPLPARVADLLARMTVEEKAGALDTSVPPIQRLGVPGMPSGEALHGPATGCVSNPAPGSTGCPTSFPCALALASAFDPALWTLVGTVIGTEARALHNLGAGNVWVFAPNVNPCRSPQWGRCQEVPGEDVFVVSTYATSIVQGIQGDPSTSPPDPRYVLTAATAKHFVAYDLEGYEPRTDPLPRPPSGTCDTPSGCQRWNFDARPPARDLTGYYLPPFIAAATAGVRSMMCAYSGVNGQPACASDLIDSTLREGATPFDGHIVSDCTALELMSDEKWDGCAAPYPPLHCVPDKFPGHNYTVGALGAVTAALSSGVDVNCGPLFHMWLPFLASNGSVSVEALDQSVGRVYTTVLKLGLLDPGVPGQIYLNLGAESIDTPGHRTLAQRAAGESIVLLKNEVVGTAGRLLPLPSGAKLAFIGPHANCTQSFLSNYHGTNTLVDSHSPLFAALARGLSVSYAPGCAICDIVPPGFPNMPCPPGKASNLSGIPAAIAAAAAADLAILFVGLDQTSEAENFDRADIALPGVQSELVLAVLAVQPRTVLVLIHGGVIAAPIVFAAAPAILSSVYGGELAGEALLDALTGAVPPAGKTAMTWYDSNITARDIRDMDLASGGGITHGYYKGPVLFPFGFGLMYTTVAFTWADGTPPALVVRADALQDWLGGGGYAQAPRVLATLELVLVNTGGVTSDVVALVMLTAPAGEGGSGGRQLPVQALVAFTREHAVPPGEARRLYLRLEAAALAAIVGCTDAEDNAPRLGAYGLRVGDGDSPALATLLVV